MAEIGFYERGPRNTEEPFFSGQLMAEAFFLH